jgi:hypothetical protein
MIRARGCFKPEGELSNQKTYYNPVSIKGKNSFLWGTT